jgi:PIN domain nuclease of toxin-antitoxin system
VSDLVLDASAILAFINDEAGGDRVRQYLADRACLASAVNVAEVVARLSDRGGTDDDIRTIVAGLRIEIIAFDEADAVANGLMRVITKARGLSLGDRACLALARKLGLAAVTADRVWEGLLDDVEVDLVR